MERATEAVCAHCAEFMDEPAQLEVELPGMNILSSAYGDTRGDQGLCRRHQRLVTPLLTCNAFRRVGTSTAPG